ncbi:MAG: dockerin type I repeat-containing protein [Oscillospiraceae bacterium]|nr:dockerin type I repeat-containing protein [Oscillospiraceae bacterium]
MSTSTPAVYNGRAYIGVSGVGQFTAYSGHNITVIDLNSWVIAYTVRTQGFPQTSGLLTTAYEEETGSVNVYFFDNYTPGKLRMITDRPGQTEPAVTVQETYTYSGKTNTYDVAYVLFTPYGDHTQYALCSPIVDEYGVIYYKNDSAHLMALGSTIEKLEITKLPDKTEYNEGETFDPTGMEVTATYSNGMTRDVTNYVQWWDGELTSDDSRFQIYFPYVLYHDVDGVAGTDCDEPFAVLELTVHGVMKGDVNGDGTVNADDAAILYGYVKGTYTQPLTDDQRAAMDVNRDGVINSRDAAMLYAYVRGTLYEFPKQTRKNG